MLIGERWNGYLKKHLEEKIRESLSSVLPITAIVLLLSISITPISSGTLVLFLFGALLLVLGMGMFTLGADLAMTPMGEGMGIELSKAKKSRYPIMIGLVFGIIITLAEPDLQVLAGQVPSIPSPILIASVAGGVGLFLVLALLRMLFRIPLPPLLVFFYILAFVLTLFVPDDFLSVAFDSGGVTTGPMTVPFIMAMGVGVASIRNDRHAADDSFGLVALCSIGPIVSVLILGMIYHPGESSYIPPVIPSVETSVELWALFHHGFPTYIVEIAVSLLPIVLFFGLFQIVVLRLSRRTLSKMLIGLAYTYIGLVLFMTGVNVGFMPAGNYLGQILGASANPWILIPIAMVMGFFIVKAEPAVYVLNKQVEEITDGAISAASMGTCLSAGVAISLGIAMLRVLTGISVMWFLIPGYAFALGISFFVPKIYTAIAFDSGGVASGPMTAAFLLPLAQGACGAVGGSIVMDAFGIVAMVAMTPLITIQLLGLLSQRQKGAGKRKHRLAGQLAGLAPTAAPETEDVIIEL